MSQILKDSRGNKIGEIKNQGDKLIIVDSRGNKQGTYDPKTNTTYDSRGNKYGSGNLLTSLL